jgi:hypothetical protein
MALDKLQKNPGNHPARELLHSCEKRKHCEALIEFMSCWPTYCNYQIHADFPNVSVSLGDFEFSKDSM